MNKKDRKGLLMFGVRLTNANLEQLLIDLEGRVQKRQKTLIFTPNAEFLVYAAHHPNFVQLLNKADYNLPDGVGISLWNRICRLARVQHAAPLHRMPGSAVVEKLLELANERHWQIGVAGARGGERAQQELQFARLQKRFPDLKIENLDLTRLAAKRVRNSKLEIRNLDLVFACHGMVKQEEWILANKDKIDGVIFAGIGGSLDYLTDFAPRPPVWIRTIGFEWLWRLVTKPKHLPRVWRAVGEFSWLMMKKAFFIWLIIMIGLSEPMTVLAAGSLKVDLAKVNGSLSPLFAGFQSNGYKTDLIPIIRQAGGLGSFRIYAGSFAQSRFLYSHAGEPMTYRIITSDDVSLVSNRDYRVEFQAFGPRLILIIDGQKIFEANDVNQNTRPLGCPTLLATHDWSSTYKYRDFQIQKLDETGNSVGDKKSFSGEISDYTSSGDYYNGPARQITVSSITNVFGGTCADLGRHYAFTATIRSENSPDFGSGYLGLGLFNGTYNFLWNNGKDCEQDMQCGGIGGWNNRRFARELQMADEIDAAPLIVITPRLAPETLVQLLADLKNKKYNNKDYLTANLEAGLFIEVGDEEYDRPEYRHNITGYAKQINDYAQAAHKISPQIKIGYTGFFGNSWDAQGCFWDKQVVPLIIDEVDFIAISHYPNASYGGATFEENYWNCECPTDPQQRPAQCDEVWEGPIADRIERIRTYLQHALELAGFTAASPQNQKAQQIPIAVSGFNMEGNDGRDLTKFFRQLGAAADRSIVANIVCCGFTAGNPVKGIEFNPRDDEIKLLYFFKKHFGQNSLYKEITGDFLAYASRSNDNKTLYLMLKGKAGDQVRVEVVNGQVSSTEPAKVWDFNYPEATTPQRTFNPSSLFTYQIGNVIDILEIPLGTAGSCPVCSTTMWGDADCNGMVNGLDFAFWRQGQMEKADFNCDSKVDNADLQIWGQNVFRKIIF